MTDLNSGAVVGPQSHVTLHYSVRLADGSVVFSTREATPATLQLGGDMLPPALEQCLIGLHEGERQVFELSAGVAYGDRNPDLVQKVSRQLLDQQGVPGEQYAPGDVVEFPTPDGGRYAGAFKGWGGDDGRGGATWALFDFNHPLAGQALAFEVEVIGVL